VQSTGNHEMKHQPEIAIETNGNALSDASQLADDSPFNACERRLRGSQ
jgi:hypothetical protein